MFLILLMVTHITAEWVEISQQHYRKPLRIHNIHKPFTTIDKIEIEDTTKFWEYNNKNVSYNKWNKVPAKQTIETNLKDVQISSDAETLIEDDIDRDLEDKFELQPFDVPTATYIGSAIPKGIIERVPSRSNVKRVQPNNNAVKVPAINFKSDKDKILNDRYEEFPLDNEQEYDGTKSIQNKFNNRRKYLNTLKNQYIDASTIPTNEDKNTFIEEIHLQKKLRPKPQYRNHTSINNKLYHTPTFITETEEFTYLEEQDDTLDKFIQKKHFYTTEASNVDDEVGAENNNNVLEQTTVLAHITYDQKYGDHNISASVKQQSVSNTSVGIKLQEEILESQIQDYIINVNEDRENKEKLLKHQPDSKVNNMEHLLKLLKVVANTISQNSQRSFGGKVKYLHKLKDSILANIADRIESTWPDDDTTNSHRSSRSTKTSPRGQHLYFPSSESALMTISFLTFAVFLIKLVLQLINTYKNKAMMVAPVMVASGKLATDRGHR